MDEVEMRELRYFVAVAEELHFARAAERLRIVQPALSRAIRKLESRLGVPLLSRDSRNVSLTPAGTALLYHAQQILAAVDEAVSITRTAHRTAAPLRLVVKPGGDSSLLPRIMRLWNGQREVPAVDIVFGGLLDRVDHLRDGRADLAILYLPFDDVTDLEHRLLVEEPHVAVLPTGHRLAGRQSVTTAELEGEPMARWKGTGSDQTGPEVSTMSEFAVVLALGRAITVIPRSTVGLLSAEAVCVPVTDVASNRTVIAWVSGTTNPFVPKFADVARAAAGDAEPVAPAVVG